MRYPAYPRYKASGVEWLGDVPEHWKLARIKHLAQVRQGVTKGRDLSGKETCELPYLRVANVQDGYLDLTEIATIDILPSEIDRFALRAGDVLLNEGGDNDKLGRGTIWCAEIDPCLHQNHVFSVRPRDMSASTWIALWTQTAVAKSYFFVQGKQTTNLASISSTSIKELPVALPPVSEQDTIADFLNRQTATLDELVEKKRALVERLKEKRTALISRTVTRGLPPAAARAADLDPHPKLAPCGIDSLGEIPERWTVKHLMHLTDQRRQIMYGIVLPGPDVDEGIPIVKGGDVKPGRLTLDRLCRTTFEIEAGYVRSRLKRDDIVFSIRGSIGESELVPEGIEGANLTQDAARVAHARDIDPKWLLYSLKAQQVIDPLLALSLGAAVRGVNIRDLKRVKLPVPPFPEQRAIADYLDRETAKIDQMVAKVEAAIERLLEYRTALITAVVTGKIDVRGLATAREQLWLQAATEAGRQNIPNTV